MLKTRVWLATTISLAAGSLALASAASATSPAGTLSVIAGRPPVITATAATTNDIRPAATAVDSAGNVYIADGQMYVEKVTPSGQLTIIAGNGRFGVPVAGPATSSPIQPTGVAVDASGNVYVAEVHGHVVKVTSAGQLSIFAGNGDTSRGPTAGPATSSPMRPTAVAVDTSGNVYVADNGIYVDKVTPAGQLSIYAGSGTFEAPTAGPATASSIAPSGVAVDPSGNLYIDDDRGYVEKVSPAGQLSVIAGNGDTSSAPTAGAATSSSIGVNGVAADAAGNVYVADGNYDYVEKVTSAGQLSIFAGTGSCCAGPTSPSGTATATSVEPSGVAVGSGSVYVSDGSGYVEKVTSDGNIATIAGGGSNAAQSAGPATSRFVRPTSVAVDSAGDAYIADGPYVEKVDTAGQLSIFAGNGSFGFPAEGAATSSPLNAQGVAVDASGNVYVADGAHVVKVTPAGQLSIIAGNGSSGTPVAGPATSSPIDASSVAVDSAGNVYVVDSATYVDKVTPAGQLSIFAGNGNSAPAVAGPATSSPMSPQSVGVDAAGDVYIVDNLLQVDKVTPAGTLSIFAGSGQTGATVAGPATATPLNPSGVAGGPAGNVYIAEFGGHVDRVNSAGHLDIVAGNGMYGAPVPGPALASPMSPAAIAVDTAGDIYIADLEMGRASGYVEKVTAPPTQGTFTVTSAASVTGTGAVGNTLTAHPGTTTPAATSVTYQWLRNGAIVTGATSSTYSLTPGDAGSSISVKVTDAAEGYASLVQTAAGPANVAQGTIAVTTNPSTSGTAAVGRTLTANPGVTNPAATSVSYQWLRDGVAVAGATGNTHALLASDLGTSIAVKVTYAAAGYQTTSRTYTAANHVAPGLLVASSAPTISGTDRVGKVLSGHPGSWSPSGVKLAYQWLLSGKAIRGATGSTLKILPSYKGKTIALRVTASKYAYTTRSATSRATARVA